MNYADMAIIIGATIVALQLLIATGVGLVLYRGRKDNETTDAKLDGMNKVVNDTLEKTKQANVAAAGILELDA